MTSLHLPGWRHEYSGKVRDLFVPEHGDASVMLVVASNRVSAFDHLLEPPIPGKGALLTRLSLWWFDVLGVPHHLAENSAQHPPVPDAVAERAMLTHRLDMEPIECVVRGALTGSGFAEYEQTGMVCGIRLPDGLSDGDLLPEPIFTPAYKAPLGEHDENITFDATVELVGPETAEELRARSLAIFSRASEIAAERGLILADTKFEFGRLPGTGDLLLADEVLTSDSSRYWDADIYATATGSARLASFDKQIVRDWLRTHWDETGTPPALPENIVQRTRERYAELFERLTGAVAWS